MENRRNRPEDEGNKDEESTPKRRRGGDFLSQYLLRRRELLDENKEQEEDQEDETDEKPKKWRRLFSGVFKRVVAPPEGGAEALERRRTRESTMFASTASSEQSAEVPDVETNIPETTDIEDVSPVESDSQEQQASEEAPEEDVQPSAQQESEVAHNIPEIPQQQRAEAPFTSERAVYERSLPEPQEREVVIERGVGTALPVVLVGAEYLARRRADKRIERKFTKQVGSLEKDINQGELARRQLDTLVQQNREQLEALKRERSSVIEKSPAPVRTEAARPKIDKQPLPRPETVVNRERKPELQTENKPKLEYTPEQQSRLIMEKVADAAENDVAVESAYELRHEIKDEPTVGSSASSVGAIMAAKLAEQGRASHQLASNQVNSESGLPVINDQQQADMYKKAMHAGFWAAMCIIIIGTLAYLMVK